MRASGFQTRGVLMSRRVGSLLRWLLGPASGSSAELLDDCDLDDGVTAWASCDDPRRGIMLLGR
jgi:hypothetical protein